MCAVSVTGLPDGEEMTKEEINAYLERAKQKFHCVPESINIHVDGDNVDIEYRLPKVPFERIRRITGYLVGTLDKWNNGKLAEERDRVKHSV